MEVPFFEGFYSKLSENQSCLANHFDYLTFYSMYIYLTLLEIYKKHFYKFIIKDIKIILLNYGKYGSSQPTICVICIAYLSDTLFVRVSFRRHF